MKSDAWILLLLLVGLVLSSPAAHATPPSMTSYNPKPAEGDLVLPMSNGAEMVFREVRVPGKNFWGNVERVIQIGDASGGIFEGLQRVQISGSFRDVSGENWIYCLGLHDMFGNVQELTNGLFFPEIWQGKPGGVTARGGSASTKRKTCVPPTGRRSKYITGARKKSAWRRGALLPRAFAWLWVLMSS